tara:strand:+ start:358 stop:540 length:183 start_codon:yes stop_codon:yes gene_type:complete
MKIIYKIKQISLEPDTYGKHIKIKMISKYDSEGKFIKHVKLDEAMINILSNSIITAQEDK